MLRGMKASSLHLMLFHSWMELTQRKHPYVGRNFSFQCMLICISQHGLPALHSIAAIDDLPAQQVNAYLIGYGISLLAGPNPEATANLRKTALRSAIRA